MRCPKCGAFMEDSRQVCFMCGVNVKEYNRQQAMQQQYNTGSYQMPNNFNNTGANSGYGSSDSSYFGNVNRNTNAFSSGNNVNNVNNFTNAQIPQSNAGHETFKHLNDYDKIYDNVKNNDKDIFDFFTDNKKLVTILGVILTLGLLSLIGWRYSVSRTKEKPVEPILSKLYFKADSSLNAIEGGSGNSAGIIFTKDGTTGSACSIKIYSAPSTSENYVHDYFKATKYNLEPEKNTSLKPINEMDVFISQEGEITLNGTLWYFLNAFYKAKSTDTSPTLLKHRYLSTIYKGSYYNVELTNNQGEASCEAALDNTVKSLKFVDTEK